MGQQWIIAGVILGLRQPEANCYGPSRLDRVLLAELSSFELISMSISMKVHDQTDCEVSPATFTFFVFACLAVYRLLKTIQNFGVAGLRGILLFFVQCYLSHSATQFRLDQSLVSNPCEEASDSGLHKENELTFCLLLRFLNFNYNILFWLLERWPGSDGSSSIIH